MDLFFFAATEDPFGMVSGFSWAVFYNSPFVSVPVFMCSICILARVSVAVIKHHDQNQQVYFVS